MISGTADFEITEQFLRGLNSDLARLVNCVDTQTQLEEKMMQAEFTTGGFRGSCNSCFKDLDNEQLILVCTTSNMSSELYRVCTCLDCSKKKIAEFRKRYKL